MDPVQEQEMLSFGTPNQLICRVSKDLGALITLGLVDLFDLISQRLSNFMAVMSKMEELKFYGFHCHMSITKKYHCIGN
jgi:hypothetical protein